MNRIVARFVVALCTLVVLAGCASTSVTKSGDQARFAEPNMRIDKILSPAGLDGTVKELYMLQAEFVGVDGEPLTFRDASGNLSTVFRTIETSNSLPFVREFILGVSPVAAVAFINGRTARSVAEKGACGAGSVCPGATVVNNQLSSVAQAVNENKVGIDVNAGMGSLPCARTNTCAKLGD